MTFLRGYSRSGALVDPVALLKREHKGIRDQLDMIEAVIGPRRDWGHAREYVKAMWMMLQQERPATIGRTGSTMDRDTLRELFRFFTGPVGVHFAREEVLIRTLGRTLTQRREEWKQLENILLEHRVLKTDARGILKRLTRKTAGAAGENGTDLFGISSFVQRYRELIAFEEHILYVLYVLAEMRLTADQKLRLGQRMLQI